MKKMYFKLILAVTMILGGLPQGFSQLLPSDKFNKSDLKGTQSEKHLKKEPAFNLVRQFDLQCGLLDPFPESATLDIVYYGQQYGFLAGTNAFGDKQKANFFDLSGSPYTVLLGFQTLCFVYVPDSSKIVTWRVFDGTSGTPGTELQNFPMTLKPLADSLAAGSINTIVFPSPVNLPASKKIFIAIDYSNLKYASAEYFTVISADSTTPYNLAWEQWSDNTWHPFSDANTWNDSSVLAIFPIICQDIVTPVTISGFSGNQFNGKNTLTWTTATESNNKGFELQRSTDGINFKTLAFIPSKAPNGNSNSQLEYEYTDANAFNSSNYYRIRQVDHNGNVTYTKIVRLLGISNKLELVSVYPNPVKSRLNLDLLTPKSGLMLFTVTNMAGSRLLQYTQNVTVGENNINMGVQQLPAGNYILNMINTAGGESISTKFIKE